MPTVRSSLLFALVLALLPAACSGGVSIEEYFDGLESATTSLDVELDAIEAEFNGGLLEINFEATGAEANLIGLFQTSMSSTAASFRSLLAGLERLDPPAEVAASHADAVAAGRRLLASYEERTEELAAIAELADIDAYAQSLADDGARLRFAESCRDLQTQADLAGVMVDLGC